MRYLKIFTTLLILGLLLNSCCGSLDCLTGNYQGQFRIIKTADGKDLVFGANKIYDSRLIKFYSLNNNDTTFFHYQTERFPGNGYDSILAVDFYPNPPIAYMRLSDGDVDTLTISYTTRDTKCCGRITEITNFRFNNSTDIAGSKGTQEIKK